jgi:glutamate N-acetyltransferase/amino-acid N-acetyltransferase
MTINLNNLLNSISKNSKIGDFQDLEHIDGLSISSISANLYSKKRDDVVMFYFRNGANHASVYTQSKLVSENIKWNLKINKKRIKALLINTRNANAFTGKNGFKGLKILAENLSQMLTEKQKIDEEKPEKILPNEILFACTGTIGEAFPTEKIKSSIPELIENIKYNQNKYIWVKAAMGILTTDLKPKLAMEECYIGNKLIRIYGIAKGSGMIYPNMATTLGFIFTDANISSTILKQLLKQNIQKTFNAISCDGDTSTNDMVSIFATGEASNSSISSIKDKKLKLFNSSLFNVLLNLAKRVAADGEGASKFVTVKVKNCKTEQDAKKVSFSIANSPLVKTAIAGEDPNWGRIIMAIGKADVNLNPNKISIKLGHISIIENGKLLPSYNEYEAADYMKSEKIDLIINLNLGKKDFTSYTMDLTKKYVEINSDYRT